MMKRQRPILPKISAYPPKPEPLIGPAGCDQGFRRPDLSPARIVNFLSSHT
jgi:hypothetical protein